MSSLFLHMHTYIHTFERIICHFVVTSVVNDALLLVAYAIRKCFNLYACTLSFLDSSPHSQQLLTLILMISISAALGNDLHNLRVDIATTTATPAMNPTLAPTTITLLTKSLPYKTPARTMMDNNNTDDMSNAIMLAGGSSSLKPSPALMIPHPPPAIKTSGKLFNKSLPKRRKAGEISAIPVYDPSIEWKCPNVTSSRSLECGCDLPHTLRCTGDLHGLTVK